MEISLLAGLFFILFVVAVIRAVHWNTQAVGEQERSSRLTIKLNRLGSLKEIFLDQGRIDEILRRKAIEFHEACLSEVHRQQFDSFEKYEAAFGLIRSNVQRTKEVFWDAHAVAKDSGYNVREKYSDYLPKSGLSIEPTHI